MDRSAIDLEPAWRNAVAAVLPNAFIRDLAISVTNDGSDDTAARWLLGVAVDFLRNQGRPHGPVAAFDFAIVDIEAIGDAWPMMGVMAEMVDASPRITPTLARFMAERLPAIWGREPWRSHPLVTRTLILADRAHDLVGLFAAGLKPNGSKDPYALRRAANHWLMQVVCPVTVGRG